MNEYYTVGDLRKAIENIPDNAPVVSAPINENVRVALDLVIAHDAKLGEYNGDVVVFNTGLFDIGTGKEINLVAPNENK